MTVEAIEDAAISGRMPVGMDGAEKWLFLCLRRLHGDYRSGYISREDGAREKQMLLGEFEQYRFADKLRGHAVKLWREVEGAGNRYAKSRTLENADGLYRAVYGVGVPNSQALGNLKGAGYET